MMTPTRLATLCTILCAVIAGLFLHAAPAAIAAGSGSHSGGQHSHQNSSPYAGEQKREIKSLSPDDIAELRRGGGWGLAKAAELNGMPGPAHVLELADQLELTANQREKITALFNTMQKDAQRIGAAFIAAEQRLEKYFQDRRSSKADLEKLITDSANKRAELRFAHLRAHLETPAILSPAQVATYNKLRGYSGNTCASAPAGHDPAMWRRHNGCD